MLKFHSKVVRVKEMGGKVVVEFKEKVVTTEDQDGKAGVDTNEVILFESEAGAEIAINNFME